MGIVIRQQIRRQGFDSQRWQPCFSFPQFSDRLWNLQSAIFSDNLSRFSWFPQVFLGFSGFSWFPQVFLGFPVSTSEC